LNIDYIDQRHTGACLFDNFEKIVKDFKIKEKVTAVVTDSASNMLKAFRVPIELKVKYLI
jgi:hypothetical protein